MIQRLFLGLIGIFLGVFIVAKHRYLVKNLGSIAWAEKYLGGAGTSRFYQITGVLIVLISFFYMGGVLEKVIAAILVYFANAFGLSLEGG